MGIAGYGYKWLDKARNDWKWLQMTGNILKYMGMAING